VKVIFAVDAWRDYAQWAADDPTLHARINALIEECLRHPFSGTGKPEPLKRNLAGWWSRRINREHRLVYRMSGGGNAQVLEVLSCRYHY
jgi:toxin YoeB